MKMDKPITTYTNIIQLSLLDFEQMKTSKFEKENANLLDNYINFYSIAKQDKTVNLPISIVQQ